MRRFLIIANPASGSGRGKTLAQSARKELANHDIKSDIVFTSLEVPLSAQLETLQTDSVTDLLIVGGDGTINSAINHMDRRWAVSFLPAGTGNDFVKNIAIGSNFPEYMQTAISGTFQAIDVGNCNGRLFLNGVGVGFDGQVVKEMLEDRGWFSGHLAYYWTVLKILAGYKPRPIAITADDLQLEEDLFLMTIGNGTTFGGGFRLTPNASLNDGMLDICVIRQLPPWKRFANIHRLSKGTHFKLMEVSEYKTANVRIEGDSSVAAHIDGDFLGQPPFDIKVLPAAFNIRVKSALH